MLRDGQVFSVSMGILANGITINVATRFTVINGKWDVWLIKDSLKYLV